MTDLFTQLLNGEPHQMSVNIPAYIWATITTHNVTIASKAKQPDQCLSPDACTSMANTTH